jgi:hypothetical protein
MDKRKEIEEMAKELHDLILDTPFNGTEASCDKIAEELLKHYQPKIPENAVVLTREAYENLGVYEETVQEYGCNENGQPILTKERTTIKKLPPDLIEFVRAEMETKYADKLNNLSNKIRLYQGLLDDMNGVRKKTAEKFSEKLKEALFDLGNVVTEKDIDEICKEFTGES